MRRWILLDWAEGVACCWWQARALESRVELFLSSNGVVGDELKRAAPSAPEPAVWGGLRLVFPQTTDTTKGAAFLLPCHRTSAAPIDSLACRAMFLY
jgi:hypothetical protein